MSTAVKEEQNKNSQHQEYDSYRKIRNQFVSKIPSHWSDASLIHVSEMNPSDNEIPDYKRDQEATFLPMEAVGIGEIHEREETKTIEDAADGYTYFRENDILLATITPCFENGKLAIATDLKNDIGFGSTEFSVISPNSTLKDRYLFYYLQSQEFKEAGTASMRGAAGQKRVPEKFLRAHKIPLPSQKEQKAIVHFLDQETEKIDRLIEQKERLIELLEEKREALITRAVTKGLDPDAEMKDSGVEWLGRVPNNWDTIKVRYLFENLDKERVPLSSTERDKRQGEYPYYGASGIIDHIDDYLFDEPLVLVAEDGANLLSRSTPLSFIAKGKYWVNNHVHVLRAKKEPIEYWKYILRSIPYEPYVEGSAQPKLTQDNLSGIEIPVPPITERKSILNQIDKQTKQVNDLVDSIQTGIDKLKEYRKSLISNSVTGKIDVREEVNAD